MIVILLPQGSAFYDQRLELDGTTYVLSFAWNARAASGAGAWGLSVADADGNPLVSGVTVVSNRLLLARYRYMPGIPPGDFMAQDATALVAVPGYTDLGDLVPFVYFEAADLAGRE